MEYFLSHFRVIIFACFLVSISAVLWWYLLEKNTLLKRQRAKARDNNKKIDDKSENIASNIDNLKSDDTNSKAVSFRSETKDSNT